MLAMMVGQPKQTETLDQLDDIRRVDDPVRRTREAVKFTAYAEDFARQGRAVRDAALRELKASGMSMPEISRQTSVNLNTVKVVLR